MVEPLGVKLASGIILTKRGITPLTVQEHASKQTFSTMNYLTNPLNLFSKFRTLTFH